MKPIKKGMTDAVTRDGRKVSQLKWFEGIKSGHYCVYGVLDSVVHSWDEEGKYIAGYHAKDIFAHVEYEWQWLVKNNDGTFDVSAFRRFDSTYAGQSCFNGDKGPAIWYQRIEESKREAK